MLGRCPLYASHGPAADIVSVVHFPATLTSTLRPVSSPRGNGGKASSSARRSDVGEMATVTSGRVLAIAGGVTICLSQMESGDPQVHGVARIESLCLLAS